MTELNILDEEKSSRKIYNKRGVILGAFFGGPIAVGYFLVENYKSLDKREFVHKAWGITIISTVLYYIVAYLMETVLNTTTIPLYIACLIGTRQVFKQIQEADVEVYVQQGGNVHSNWRTVGISLLFLIGTLGILGTMVFLFNTEKSLIQPVPPPIELVEINPPARNTTSSSTNITKSAISSLESKSYGEAAHVIVYNNFFFSELKIDSIAEQLTTLGFFDGENRKEVYIEKVLFDYEFSIIDASAAVNKEKTNLRYEKLRANMETFLKDGKVFILLKDESLEEVLARFGEEI
jgi:hypothetical protein